MLKLTETKWLSPPYLSHHDVLHPLSCSQVFGHSKEKSNSHPLFTRGECLSHKVGCLCPQGQSTALPGLSGMVFLHVGQSAGVRDTGTISLFLCFGNFGRKTLIKSQELSKDHDSEAQTVTIYTQMLVSVSPPHFQGSVLLQGVRKQKWENLNEPVVPDVCCGKQNSLKAGSQARREAETHT